MSLYKNIYFAALVGALAGILTWGGSSLLLIALDVKRGLWIPDATVVFLLGFLLALFVFRYMDYAAGKPMRWATVGWGALCGLGSAVVVTLILSLLQTHIQVESPTLFRLVAWALAGSLIGMGVGLRWVKNNRVRVLHTYAGGLAGGLVGGLLFTFLGPHSPEICQAFGLMLTGAGTGLGAALSPMLMRDGAVQFISSGDARAQSKLGRTGKQWPLEPGESYVLGNIATSDTGSRFQQGVDIFVPDSFLSPRHAVLFSKEGRYFIARHPDAGGPAGIAKFILRVRGKTVTTSQELHESDDILVGRTALRFSSKKLHD
ncbi:FHA domain-containing protein [Edaphobacter dinghuensis]|uniref:FHA domain-containing protein n=1 Tax=Edaphobacter dinghuensis TaxID=1560005 RepID=A0A917H5I0_9BACT|nr:FHA domain-containing protein [Edaphobacter dinghuensis]GGG67784.1 hypothetical protein GCM10011585_07140 [Edaphobacter dinghuensis]